MYQEDAPPHFAMTNPEKALSYFDNNFENQPPYNLHLVKHRYKTRPRASWIAYDYPIIHPFTIYQLRSDLRPQRIAYRLEELLADWMDRFF